MLKITYEGILMKKSLSVVCILITMLLASFSAQASSKHCHNKSFTNVEVLAWSYEAMMESYNHSFVNIKKELQDARDYYNLDAWKQFYATVKPTLKEIQAKKMVVSVGLENSPLLLSKSKNQWKVQLPLIIHYQTATEQKIVNAIANVTIKPGVCDNGLNLQIVNFEIKNTVAAE